MNKSKKGFTLVELLAVIVVLVIITVIAINKISDIMKKNNENAVVTNSMTFIRNINQNADQSRLTGNFQDGQYTVAQLKDMGAKMNGTTPNSGDVVIFNGKVVYACFIFDKFSYLYSNKGGIVSKSDECILPELEETFSYTGGEQKFTVPYYGVYKLEVWGAQGGVVTVSGYSGSTAGGYGSYSRGEITLLPGQILYVNVGGKGAVNSVSSGQTQAGGYNGGGSNSRDQWGVGGTGGGATHIATASGLLSSFKDNREPVIIVAGGGGAGGIETAGAGRRSAGGNAGGYLGNSGSTSNCPGSPGAGGSQIAGAAFGKGAAGGGWYGTSGGGWYGGYHGCGGGGGSGYIANTLLTNKEMFCYGCSENSDEDKKTTAKACVQGTATPECSKTGDGYAKITLVRGVTQ